KLLVNKGVVSEKFELSFLSVLSHGVFGLQDLDHIPGAPVSLQKIQSPGGFFCFLFRLTHLDEKLFFGFLDFREDDFAVSGALIEVAGESKRRRQDQSNER